MKKISLVFMILSLCLWIRAAESNAQTLQTISIDSLFKGQKYPNSIIVNGDSIFPNQYKVFGVYFYHKYIPNSNFTLVDSNYYPTFFNTNGVSNTLNSFEVSSGHFVPFSVDTGMYNLILAKCNPGPLSDTVLFDTLFNALYISKPDTIIGGKVFCDINQNKVYDFGDSLISGINILCDLYSENIRYDSLGNYYFPVAYGNHRLISPRQNDYVLWTDSNFFTFNTDSVDSNGYDFGYVRGLFDCTPDTVHQLDTVVFDLYGHGVLDSFFIQYGFLIDSSGQQITFYGLSDVVSFIDSNHMQVNLVIPITWHGSYSIILPYQILSLQYTLNNAFYVLPPLSSSISENNSNGRLTVNPNPATNFISFVVNGRKQLNLFKIYSMSGFLILEGNVEQTLDISVLNQGLFVLEIIADDGSTYLCKFIKE